MVNTRELIKFPAFAGLDPQQQEYFFDIAKEKVVHHIDSFYYRVYLKGDSNDNQDVQDVINEIRELKLLKLSHPEHAFEYHGLTVELGVFGRYSYRLSCGEDYDVFFISVLPNLETPRIVVQLRSRTLVLNGVLKSICKSFAWLEDFLEIKGLSVSETGENRIDYAYHTNLIQNPYKHFADHNLIKHMRSTMRRCRSHGDLIEEHRVPIDKIKNIHGDEMDISYFSIGSQNSKNVFVRIYNKTQEVIEQNYKSFFLDRWLEHKLINRS